jgi:hypothetical protein
VRVLATAQDDAEIVETGLGGGQTGGRICRNKNLAAGTRGEIELGIILGTVRKTFELRIKSSGCCENMVTIALWKNLAALVAWK